MLCKDSQIAKRKRRRGKKGNVGLEKANRVFGVVCVCMCALKVRQSIPTLQLQSYGERGPAADSSPSAYLIGNRHLRDLTNSKDNACNSKVKLMERQRPQDLTSEKM